MPLATSTQLPRLTVKQAADRIGVSRETVRRYALEGLLTRIWQNASQYDISLQSVIDYEEEIRRRNALEAELAAERRKQRTGRKAQWGSAE